MELTMALQSTLSPRLGLQIAVSLAVVAGIQAPVRAQQSEVPDDAVLILFLHTLAEPTRAELSEAKERAAVNQARILGVSVAEAERAAGIAKSYQQNEDSLKREAQRFSTDLAERKETTTEEEIRRFSDRRAALARAAWASIEQELSPESSKRLRSYVFGQFRRTIEIWR